MPAPTVTLFEAELESSGLRLPSHDYSELFLLWQENFERRDRMRNSAIEFDEWSSGELTDITDGRNATRLSAVPAHSTKQQFAPSDLAFATISELSRLIERRKISVRELVSLYLSRIERLDPATRAFISVLSESALADAKASDERLTRGEWLGQLHGIPIAIKDMIGIRGVPFTGGSISLTGNIARTDSTVTSRLRRSGAIMLGTNSLFEFGLGPAISSGSDCTGLNPWDPSRSTGGSSSGSAVAVAAGLCAAACGTDTAGSIRLPAALCGTVGLKPTNGLVPLNGVIPMCWSLDTVGPLTRTVADAAIMLEAMLGMERQGRFGSSYGAGMPPNLQGIRVGLLRRDFVDAPDVDPCVRAAIEDAVRWFLSNGCTVVDVSIPNIQSNEIVYASHITQTYSIHRDALRRNPSGYHAKSRAQIYLGALVTADDWFRAKILQQRLRVEFASTIRDLDVLMLPGQGKTAAPLDTPAAPALMKSRSRFTRVWNMIGAPAITVPAGHSGDGLPISVQFVGHPWQDQRLLGIAGAYETFGSPARRAPPLVV